MVYCFVHDPVGVGVLFDAAIGFNGANEHEKNFNIVSIMLFGHGCVISILFLTSVVQYTQCDCGRTMYIVNSPLFVGYLLLGASSYGIYALCKSAVTGFEFVTEEAVRGRLLLWKRWIAWALLAQLTISIFYMKDSQLRLALVRTSDGQLAPRSSWLVDSKCDSRPIV
jgi:hypothetical protein